VARPENEAVLLNIGRGTSAAQLERICRELRRAAAGEDGAPEAERWVSSRPAADGNVEIVMRLRPEEAAMVMKAVESSAEGGDKADGAVAMAESVLRGGAGKSPAEIVVHIDADTLAGTTELGDGLPPETCKRLLCDAGVVPMLEAGGRVIDAGRKSRVVSSALKRALVSRDGGCRFPGCDHRLVDAHHLDHWVHGGETVQENLLLLCRRHHVAAHEGAFSIEGDPCDALVFRDAGGQVIEAAPPLPAPGPSEPAEAWGLVAIDGSPVQYDYVFDVLASAVA
jgi:hypothetical protein